MRRRIKLNNESCRKKGEKKEKVHEELKRVTRRKGLNTRGERDNWDA